MIKTIQYNDFSELSTDILYDKKLLLEEIEQFCENNGDLNLDIKPNSYDKLVPAEKWLRERLQDVQKMNSLFERGYLESPFNWKLEGTKIIENPLYGGYWFRDNKDFYENYMAEGIKKLLENLSDNNIEPTAYVETSYEKKLKEITYHHPLVYLADKLENPAVYDTIFTMRPEYKKLWLEESMFRKNQPNYIYSIGLHNSTTINSEVGKVFYEHGIIKDFLHQPENSSSLKAVIKMAIFENDIDFLKKHIKNWDIPAIEKDDDRSYCFLVSAKNKEVAQLLLDNGAFVMGQLKPTDKYETSIFPSEYLTNQEVMETILDFKEEYRNLVVTHSNAIYDQYFSYRYENLINMFIKKYNFPVGKHDLLKIGKDLHGIDGMKWAEDLGADLRNCKKLIDYCVNAREDGLSFLKKVHKEGIFNAFQPDSIHNILQSSPTKIFYTWLNKANIENFTDYTKEGIPAWWTTNLSSIEFIKTKVKDFNQLSEKGNNFFHYMFSLSKPSEKIMNSIITSNKISDEQLGVMLNQHNKEGITAIENVIEFLQNSDKQNQWSERRAIVTLINRVQDAINYDIVTKNDKSVYQELITHFPEFTDLNIYYQKHVLERKIPQKTNNTSQKLKI